MRLQDPGRLMSCACVFFIRPAPVLLCALLLVLPVGCGSSPDVSGVHVERSARLSAEADLDTAAVIEAYNERTSRITSLWARVSVVLEGEDAEGRDLRERGEGHLQIVPPHNVAITLGKLGEIHLYFGSNAAVYWWFDMTDKEFKVARFGRHDRVSAEKIDSLGLPIHPLDLVETLGITPIPAGPEGAGGGGGSGSSGSSGGSGGSGGGVEVRLGNEPETIIILFPADRGLWRVTVGKTRYEPSRIELTGFEGEVLLDVDLSRYRLMAGLEPGEGPLRIPERVRVRMAGFDGEIRFSLHEPTRREIKPIAFDPARLVDAYGINALIDLDMPEDRSTP